MQDMTFQFEVSPSLKGETWNDLHNQDINKA